MLTTSDSSVLKKDWKNITTSKAEDGDENGPFTTAPIATESIPVVEYPCAFIKEFMPVEIMEGSVPIRYKSRYGSAYSMAFSEAPNSTKRGLANIMQSTIKIIANAQTMVKLVFMMVFAALLSPMP